MARTIQTDTDPLLYGDSLDQCLHIPYIYSDEVITIIANIPNSASGCDELPASILKQYTGLYPQPLTLLINLSIIRILENLLTQLGNNILRPSWKVLIIFSVMYTCATVYINLFIPDNTKYKVLLATNNRDEIAIYYVVHCVITLSNNCVVLWLCHLHLCLYGGRKRESLIMYGIYQSYLNTFKYGKTKNWRNSKIIHEIRIRVYECTCRYALYFCDLYVLHESDCI